MQTSRLIVAGLCAMLYAAVGVPAVCQTANSQVSAKRADVFHDMPSQRLKDLGEKLNLSDDQKHQVVKLKKEFESQNKAALKKLRQDVQAAKQALQTAKKNSDSTALKKARADIKSLRQAGEKLNADFERKLLAILTDEQKKRYGDLQTAARSAPARTGTELSPGNERKKQ